MNDAKSYRGIDYFRLIAAFLIIAIHTSPLSTYSETGDFILTRIIARVAVPFFFMTSGFFLISQYLYNDDRLKSFVKKTALIYGVAIFIYIPLNIYNGYFKIDNLLPNILKDIFFDGTIYHLWYLPASILGAVIAWFVVKRCGFKKALIITSLLYTVGLFGDSYYGIAEKIPFLNGLYRCLFEVSDYTRNGIFIAPVFFVLGGMIADRRISISFKGSLIGCGVSFLLMFGEGMLLHGLDLQRHDSMYVFLLPCVYFLFHVLTFSRGKRSVHLRTSALVIYIIHPMMIVVVRMIAKFTHTQGLFVDNSIVHFGSVSILSAGFAMLLVYLFEKAQGRHKKHCTSENDRAWIEVDLNNLKTNVRTLKKAMPNGCNLMAVVKAEAYGHGAFEVATYINRFGVKSFAVATIDEGIELRSYGIRDEILILGFTPLVRAKELHKYDLMQTLIDENYATKLNKQGVDVKAHIKVDTGMHRLGFDCADAETVKKAFTMQHIKVCGIYTHLCVSDSLDTEDVHFTEMQIRRFYGLIEILKKDGIEIPKIHIQSSYGLLNYPELKCNYVRVGIALYGVLSSPNDQTKLQLALCPVLSLKSQIILIRQIHSDESLGYGRTFIAERDSRIAVVPIGYADGLPRALSYGNGEVLINGQRAPIIGRICMDQLCVDVTDIGDVVIGDVVTFIGKDGNDELSAPTVADNYNSITNELLSRMGNRLKIKVKN